MRLTRSASSGVWMCVLAGILLAPAAARADVVTFEPDAFASGSNLSAAMPGVHLWTFRSLGLGANPAYALLPVFSSPGENCADRPYDCAAVTGTQVFGGYWNYAQDAARYWQALNTGGEYHGDSLFTAMLIQFDSPATFVEVSGAWPFGDHVELYAFDSSFQQVLGVPTLSWLRGYDYWYPQNSMSIASATPAISYVIAGSWDEGWATLDALRYEIPTTESVPEPSSLLLLGAGVLAFRLRRRRD